MPRRPISPQHQAILLGTLLSSPSVVAAGSLAGLLCGITATIRTHGLIIAGLTAAQFVLVVVRLVLLVVQHRQQRGGAAPRVEALLWLSIGWAGFQGATALVAMLSHDTPTMVMGAALTMSIIGPLSARAYAAPRLALLLASLCDLPFKIGLLINGEPWLLVLVLLTPVYLRAVMGIVCEYHDLVLAMLESEALQRARARHDPLTGLLNRTGLEERLHAWTAAPGQRLAMLCLDLDGFKAVNDTLGHGAGDELLQRVADRLRATVRPEDAVIRLGGDEFMIVTHVRPAEVRLLSERLIQAIRGEPYRLGTGGLVRVGVSIGYACLPEDAVVPQDLWILADTALYAAKKSGRGAALRYNEAMAASPQIVTPLLR
ncbi:GGDEF domain-containing protein [Sphingomonas morindae]|uniref:GGDEF domain-containing protein n=1 Tax=Sphingomonas morindae TaxID=1541170 RepID=UPI00267446F2|nr:GGDEF domain-containing protein [Sphingomonas morindae]